MVVEPALLGLISGKLPEAFARQLLWYCLAKSGRFVTPSRHRRSSPENLSLEPAKICRFFGVPYEKCVCRSLLAMSPATVGNSGTICQNEGQNLRNCNCSLRRFILSRNAPNSWEMVRLTTARLQGSPKACPSCSKSHHR